MAMDPNWLAKLGAQANDYLRQSQQDSFAIEKAARESYQDNLRANSLMTQSIIKIAADKYDKDRNEKLDQERREQRVLDNEYRDKMLDVTLGREARSEDAFSFEQSMRPLKLEGMQLGLESNRFQLGQQKEAAAYNDVLRPLKERNMQAEVKLNENRAMLSSIPPFLRPPTSISTSPTAKPLSPSEQRYRAEAIAKAKVAYEALKAKAGDQPIESLRNDSENADLFEAIEVGKAIQGLEESSAYDDVDSYLEPETAQ